MFDEEGLWEYNRYLEDLEHEEDTRAVEYHSENVDDGHQVKGWYKYVAPKN